MIGRTSMIATLYWQFLLSDIGLSPLCLFLLIRCRGVVHRHTFTLRHQYLALYPLIATILGHFDHTATSFFSNRNLQYIRSWICILLSPNVKSAALSTTFAPRAACHPRSQVIAWLVNLCRFGQGGAIPSINRRCSLFSCDHSSAAALTIQDFFMDFESVRAVGSGCSFSLYFSSEPITSPPQAQTLQSISLNFRVLS
jgi:hypothetical protein